MKATLKTAGFFNARMDISFVKSAEIFWLLVQKLLTDAQNNIKQDKRSL